MKTQEKHIVTAKESLGLSESSISLSKSVLTNMESDFYALIGGAEEGTKRHNKGILYFISTTSISSVVSICYFIIISLS
jgi:hypothetical protein